MKRDRCPNCGENVWTEEPVSRQINPNGEYVKGYGHRPVFKFIRYDYYCESCGWKEGGNPTVIDLDGKIIEVIDLNKEDKNA